MKKFDSLGRSLSKEEMKNVFGGKLAPPGIGGPGDTSCAVNTCYSGDTFVNCGQGGENCGDCNCKDNGTGGSYSINCTSCPTHS